MISAICTILMILYLPTEDQKLPQSILKDIPDNYSILSTATSDLNLDGNQDYLLVLKKSQEQSLPDHERKRLLMLFLGGNRGEYQLQLKTENVIYAYGYDENFADSFVDLTAETGGFTIEHYGGFARRWGRTTSFSYSKESGTWRLTLDKVSISDATEEDSILSEENIMPANGRTIQEFNIYEADK